MNSCFAKCGASLYGDRHSPFIYFRVAALFFCSIKNPKLIPFFLPRLGKATFGKKGCARPERKTTKKTMNGEQEDREEEEQEEKFKVYTKAGDDGTSSLYNLERRAKSDAVFDALGDCDETNVSVGIARVHAYDDCCEGDGKDGCFDGDVLPHLEIIQSRLLDVGSAVATPITSEKTKDGMKVRCRFDKSHVELIESWIDRYEEELPPLTNFLCPGGTKFAAFLHQARAICRRCERKVQPMVKLGDVEKSVARYLNRLSDYLFVAARVANHRVGVEDVAYKKA